MVSDAIMMTILTHPLHVLLFGVILSRLAPEVIGAAHGPGRRSFRPAPGRDRQPVIAPRAVADAELSTGNGLGLAGNAGVLLSRSHALE